jgi:uncharacterized membrane protein
MNKEFLFLIVVIFVSFLIGMITYFLIEFFHPKNRIAVGCKATRWGCCEDGTTPKYDSRGTNCILGS